MPRRQRYGARERRGCFSQMTRGHGRVVLGTPGLPADACGPVSGPQGRGQQRSRPERSQEARQGGRATVRKKEAKRGRGSIDAGSGPSKPRPSADPRPSRAAAGRPCQLHQAATFKAVELPRGRRHAAKIGSVADAASPRKGSEAHKEKGRQEKARLRTNTHAAEATGARARGGTEA